MNDGEIVQSNLVDIYDEPINHFVAFHWRVSILPGKMIEDIWLSSMATL